MLISHVETDYGSTGKSNRQTLEDCARNRSSLTSEVLNSPPFPPSSSQRREDSLITSCASLHLLLRNYHPEKMEINMLNDDLCRCLYTVKKHCSKPNLNETFQQY
ncbi:hypothetical protein AVEN_68200-1 [Araneus ventricosus]|uniref:Uncharacterized protein n=1 Tax=Araneus ventricosus TaxID=182803 RepID=A0A4Y2WQH6_ARAVE|nr:hypothetical protein AVEN_68200-1 [Araneus ventricosus]